jgi:hypothetical protein
MDMYVSDPGLILDTNKEFVWREWGQPDFGPQEQDEDTLSKCTVFSY